MDANTERQQATLTQARAGEHPMIGDLRKLIDAAANDLREFAKTSPSVTNSASRDAFRTAMQMNEATYLRSVDMLLQLTDKKLAEIHAKDLPQVVRRALSSEIMTAMFAAITTATVQFTELAGAFHVRSIELAKDADPDVAFHAAKSFLNSVVIHHTPDEMPNAAVH